MLIVRIIGGQINHTKKALLKLAVTRNVLIKFRKQMIISDKFF